MLVPEAAMNEDHLLEARQNEVGCARQVATMQAETEAEGMDYPPHHQLRRHVLAADSAHVLAAPRPAQFVHSPRIITVSVLSKKNPDKGPKLNAIQARQIRELYAHGDSVLELAGRFNVSDQAIKDVLNFETWGSAGGPRKPVTR
jgi:hypothetical protein